MLERRLDFAITGCYKIVGGCKVCLSGRCEKHTGGKKTLGSKLFLVSRNNTTVNKASNFVGGWHQEQARHVLNCF